MRTIIAAALAALALAGCGGKEEKTSTPGTTQTTTGGETGTPAPESASAACPMKIQGTTVQAENVEGGAALTFTTSGDVDALRERVRGYAAMQEAQGMRGGHAGMSGMMQPGGTQQSRGAKSAEPMSDEQRGDSTMGGADQTAGGGSAKMEGAMPQVNTRVEDIDGGARLVIIPMDSNDLDSVRMHVEDAAQAMTRGECPMPEMNMNMGTEGTNMGTGYPEE